MALKLITAAPDPVTIEGCMFYPRAAEDGSPTKYYIRQSGIPDMLRKHALEWWMGKQERGGILDAVRAWIAANAAGDGVIPPGPLLALLNEIDKSTLYGYRKRDKAGDFGTSAHDWLKWRLTGIGAEPVTLPGVREAVAPAEAWITEHNVEPIAVECVVYDDESGVAGRIDMAAKVDGTVCIVDWKTGKVKDEKTRELYLEVRLQNHLYRRGWSAMHGNGSRSRGGWIVKLPRDESERFEATPVPWENDVMQMYDSLADAWRSMRRAQGKFAGGTR